MEKRPTPRIRGLVLKVASRCNLNCSYCYVYNKGDTTYQLQPRFMADETVSLLLGRVSRYCRRYRLKSFRFVFHGGEPLLAPVLFYRQFVSEVKRLLPPYTQVSYTMQTNGVLLTDAWCQVLGELDIRLGISLDGPAKVHDRYRVDHQGRGSYKATIAGLERAQAHKALRYYPGILAVIDPTTDPEAFITLVNKLAIQSLNLLLPDGTHTNLPPYLNPKSQQTPYADWLIVVFDHWFRQAGTARPTIRFFQQIIDLILGITSSTHAIGRTDNLFLIIETDGSIEAEDSLKVCQPGITKEGQHLQTHSFDDVLASPLITQCASSQLTLPTTCRGCPIQAVCGGGFIVHRYHLATGFDNPSVYCRDLLKLITHIQNRLFAALDPSFLAETGACSLSFEQALAILETNAEG
jgi:uncharacterized protein